MRPSGHERSVVAIIGAGYAGMAAAAELATRGAWPSPCFEDLARARRPARAVELHGATADNGQHILIGAYRETLRLMELVGADPARSLLRQPMHLEYRANCASPRLPRRRRCTWPGPCSESARFGWRDKFAAIRFITGDEGRALRLPRDMSTSLPRFDAQRQPQRLRDLWDARCASRRSTRRRGRPPRRRSSSTFCATASCADRETSDLLLPRVDLGKLFPDAAATSVARRSQDNAAVPAKRRSA